MPYNLDRKLNPQGERQHRSSPDPPWESRKNESVIPEISAAISRLLNLKQLYLKHVKVNIQDL